MPFVFSFYLTGVKRDLSYHLLYNKSHVKYSYLQIGLNFYSVLNDTVKFIIYVYKRFIGKYLTRFKLNYVYFILKLDKNNIKWKNLWKMYIFL